MDKLDLRINDIEPRIKEIIESIPKTEEASLQDSLAAYGWILLDAWISWRTLRFILRKSIIGHDIPDKWVQTPSSYRAQQFFAVWRFSSDILEYIKSSTNHELKTLIDQVVQEKRNAAAHFSGKSEIHGTDCQDIKQIFDCFSTIFLLYEIRAFLSELQDKLQTQGYTNIYLYDSTGSKYEAADIDNSISIFSVNRELTLLLTDIEGRDCIIRFLPEMCTAGFKSSSQEKHSTMIIDEENRRPYVFLSNKGYYGDLDHFIKSFEKSLQPN